MGAARTPQRTDTPSLPLDVHLFAGLYQHQSTELEHLLSTTNHRLLYWEQGVGKTPVVARLGQAQAYSPKLYLCPASCNMQVKRELLRRGGPDTRVQFLEGRRAKLNSNAECVVCNYDLLLSNSVFEQLIGHRWQLLVVDEAHLLRNATAKRTQRVFGLKPCLAGQADRVVLLGEDRVIGFLHHHEVADVMLAQLLLAAVSAGMIRGDTPAATRTQLIDDFDRGKLQVLLLQSQSGSLGLNLQACRYAAIVEPDWTAAVSEQAIARLYRAGQVRDVTDFLLIANSLDEHIVSVARRKAALAADLIETPIKEIA